MKLDAPAPVAAAAAPLTIRNLTATPLELKRIEHFEGDPDPDPGGLASIICAIAAFFGASWPASARGVAPRPETGPTATHDVTGVVVGPFSTHATDYQAADPGSSREVLRLTFAEPTTPRRRYAVDVPAPSSSSARPLEGPHLDSTAGGERTPIYRYVAGGATLAVLGSAAPHSWMGALPDALALSRLSIPGTHNSPACHPALPSVRCQAVGVRAQLDNGVRFLDVRVSCPRDGNDDLALVHAAFPVSLMWPRYLAGLLADVYAFLEANPGEAVLMSLKREGTGRGSDGDLSRHLHRRYAGGESAARWFTEPRIPALGEARGRIVLVRRFGLDDSLRDEHGGAGWGIDGSAWPDNCADGIVGSGMMRVQDFYDLRGSADVDKKMALVRAHLERAGQQHGGAPPLFVNFLSASNFFNARCWPENTAARINPAIVEYLCTRHGESGKGPGGLGVGDAATGIVVTDWVGVNGDWDLIRCIVGWNARLQLAQ